MKKGICCAGNIIVDITNPIATWPKQNELNHITEGNTNSTFGTNTITLVEDAKNGTYTVTDGAMTVNTATLELAHGIKLSAETKWAFEITM